MKIQLSNVRISFADLFVPKAQEAGKEPKYGACFIIDPKSPLVKAIDDAVVAVAKAKWGDKAADVLEYLKDNKKIGFLKKARTNKDGDVYSGFEGTYSVNASNKTRPLVIDRDKSPLTAADGKPYSGSYVNASIEAWAQDSKDYGRRINFALRGVQFYKDGDAFGGGAPASTDEFADLSAESADDLV